MAESEDRAAKPKAVLFDIDETLVHTGGAGARSWAWAFSQLYQVEADIGKHTSAGETDPEVGRETFAAVMGREPEAEEMVRVYAHYLRHLSEDIWHSPQYRVFDGVEAILDRLSGEGVILGVVSGAMEGAARTKLMPANLNRYFVFGAYGSDSPDRGELTRMGVAKAARLHGRELAPAEVLVVGDTPRDIEAAQRAGATGVGVATGHYTKDQLRQAGASHVLASLTEPFPGLGEQPPSKEQR
ncbi:MAG: HAD family hydrolase [Candidatus Dormibacteria bacterium]